LSLGAGGNIDLQGAVGGSTRLGNLTINRAGDIQASAIQAASITQLAGSGTTTFNGALDTNGAGGVNLKGNNFVLATNITTTNGNISFAGPVTQTGNVALNGGNGTINFKSSWAAGNNTLALMAGEMDFSGGNNSVTGTNTLSLQPANMTQAIAIGGLKDTGSTTLDITQQDLDALGGFSSIQIGGNNSPNPITINATTFKNPVEIKSSGNITVTGNITGTGPASLDIEGTNLNLGNPNTPDINITTVGKGITLGKNVILFANDVNLKTSGGNITFNGDVNGSQPDTQSLTLAPGAGQAKFQGQLGNVNRLRSLSIGDQDSIVIIGGENATLTGNGTQVFKEVTVNALQTQIGRAHV
jgi:hypothetical protein